MTYHVVTATEEASIEPDEVNRPAPEPTEPVSFEAWYRNEHRSLVAALTLACGNQETAEDIAAEAFARALATWNRVGTMASPSGWTYRVALNVLRRRARRRELERRVLRRVAPSPVVPPEIGIEVWDAVRALPKRERVAIALRYVAGLSQADVARAMGIAEGTASATLVSARRKLAVALDDRMEDDNA